MADSILRLKVESQEYDNKLKRAAEGLTRYADECRKVGGTMEVVEKETLEYVRSLGQMETTSRTATGKLAEMKKAFVELSAQYKQMTDQEKASPMGKALAESLDQLKGRIQDSKTQLDDINKSMNGGGGLSGALDAVAGKFGISIDQVTKFGGVVGIASTAVKVAKDAFFQSESGIDEWGRTVEGAKGAYSVFLDTLNNGNWSNFFQNLQTAIQGGRDLYDVFDRLGSIKSNNAAAVAIVQQQIAQLRLAKQQGENVDAQLKTATERLAALQKQSITAGMNAGNMSAFQTIRNGVNSIGGAGVNDATIQYVVDRIMKGGQAEFDKYKRNYEVLQKRGTGMTTSYQTTAYGGTMAVQKREFNLANLTKEEQKQYAIAKAVTEGETRIQQGIAAYAQAVQEGTASAREEFKGNRYALQGSGGSGGSRSVSSGGNKPFTPLPFVEAEGVKTEDLGGSEVWKTITQGAMESQTAVENLTEAFKALNAAEGNAETLSGETTSGTEDNSKALRELRTRYGMAAQAANAFGAAMQGIEDPAAKAAGTVVQAIASIALGFAMASSSANTAGTGWGWLAWLGAGMAAMATTISTIHSLTGYAEGGIVKGNSYSGDNIPAMIDGGAGGFAGLNAGEIVLNKAAQGSLAQQLEGNGMSNMHLSGTLRGNDIVIAVDRSLQMSGKGQLLTWG